MNTPETRDVVGGRAADRARRTVQAGEAGLMNSCETLRKYGNPAKAGRLDVNGVEWWACDPYPTWYRWEDGELHTNPAAWPSVEDFAEELIEETDGPCF